MESLIPVYGAGSTTAEDVWVKLQQKPISKLAQQAGFSDLTAMWYMVLAGLSAKYYKASSCPATIDKDGVVHVPLDFYVYPSSTDLNYKLSAVIGTISGGEYVEIEKEFDLVFDQESTKDLGYLADRADFTFQTAAYDKAGREIKISSVALDGSKVRLSQKCWCVLRVRCLAKGYRYTVTMLLQKYEAVEDDNGQLNWSGYSIENLDNSIQATWEADGELQSTSIDLDIPQCVQDYLATCDDGELQGSIDINGDDPQVLYWYSVCTGGKLKVKKVGNDE